ncbi:MAG: aminoacyl-tRNA hydrolase [Candidatus Omnitrophota bacterium]|nr:aminoacyl-tRNA hydrolase [Candidatus Omnitrophota bacterium]
MSDAKLIVGLGNPGKQYAYTRHNLGFLVGERCAQLYRGKFSLCSFTKALMAQGTINQTTVKIVLPTTFMNHSGLAVKQSLDHENIGLQDLFVVCDDVNLEFGRMRLREKGSDGGHNGLASIIEQLGTSDFARLRLGVGQPPTKEQMVDYVLEEFNKEEKRYLEGFIDQAAQCCTVWLNEGIHKASELFNKREKNGKD